jgi:hypothetical protein
MLAKRAFGAGGENAAAFALGLHQLLQLVTCAGNGETLVIQEITDATNHQHFMALVIAAIAATLHGTQLREFLLPIAQHVRLDAAQLAHLTNGEVALGWNGWKDGFLHENQ